MSHTGRTAGGSRVARGVALAILVSTTLGSTPAEARDTTRDREVKAATESVLSDPRYQRTRPDGSLRSPPPDLPEPPPRRPKTPSRYEPGRASGISEVILWVVGGALGAGLLLVLARELARARRRARRRGPTTQGELADLLIEVQASRLPASLARARALAQEGRFDEAAHVLLGATMDYLKALAGFSLEPSFTSREVLARAPLPADLRPPLGELVTEVELSLFGRQPLNEPDYARCEAAFLVLHDRLGHGG